MQVFETMALNVRHIEDASITIEAIVTSGGSSSYGSDESPWFNVEIIDIFRDNGKSVSDRLFNHIAETHGDLIESRLSDTYL
jgi:hypothetical protein